MKARRIHTEEVYEGGKTYIASIIGVHRNTLTRWEKKNNGEPEEYNNYIVSFDPVIREKQKKGRKDIGRGIYTQ